MDAESHYKDLTKKIIDSPSFGKSETYANLLIYLVEATLSGNIPKETTIANEIFGHDDFDPAESTLVRVYIYNLRKKLEEYYNNEGIEERLVLTIPKGSYKVEFVESKLQADEVIPNRQNATPKYAFWILLPLALVSVGLNVLLWKEKEKEMAAYQVIPQESIWSDILESELPTHVLLGDLFIYSEFDEAVDFTRVIRNADINSQEDFEAYLLQNPDRAHHMGAMSYSFLIKNSAEWIKSLTQIFFSRHKSFNIRYMTKFNSKDLQDNHIVIIGMLKTFGLFNKYFDNSKFDLLSTNTIRYQEEGMKEPQYFTPSGDPDAYHTDYGFIAKFPGPNNNIVIMCGGLWDTGASQSLKHLTDPILLAQLEEALKKKYNKVPKYFEVLLEVNGIDRTELTPSILHVGEIDPDKNLWAVN